MSADDDQATPRQSSHSPRRQLRRWTLILGGGSATLTVVLGWLASRVVGVDDAVAWLTVAGGFLLLVVGLLFVRLGHNHPPDESTTRQPEPTFGPATHVTFGRGVLLAWVGGCLALGWADQPSWLLWVPALGYGAAAALDAVDGAVARQTGRVTRLGEQLDMSFDALGLFVAPLVGVVAGQLPWWYLSVGLARYGFVAATRVRTWRNLPVEDLPPSESRRVLAGLQMAFVAVALTPVVAPAAGWAGAALFGGAFLAGFGRDWLYVSGRLGPSGATELGEPTADDGP